MKKTILSTVVIAGTLLLTGCSTDQYGRTTAMGCDTGTNYGAAAVGAVAGGLLGNAVGSGSGKVIATGAGAAIGGVAGSRSRVGC